MYEIRIHCRGGEGGVTAARLIALAAFRDGRYAMAWPFYGAERRGAPVVSFVRIDDRPIRVYSQISNPDLVVVLDPTVMDVVDVYHGLKPGGIVLLNAPGAGDVPGHRTYTVDLTGIALALNLVIAGSPVLDTSVVGAVAKLGIIAMDSAKRAVAEMFPDERNIRAAEAAYQGLVV